MTMEMYHNGRLSEAAAALSMPVMTVTCQCNAVLRCAREARPTQYASGDIRAAIAELERAAATLREALALSAPALMQAAE